MYVTDTWVQVEHFHHLQFILQSTFGGIVTDTSKVIWDVLKDKYMQVPKREQWRSVAQWFETFWNLPNCIGAIDGKHVRIEKFANSGSSNFNYKSYHSIVLMACCDADGLFTMIETGYAGRNSDGGIFKSSARKYWIQRNELDIPPPSPLTYNENYSPFPYYFVADEAFPLSRYLMRPYSQRVLDNTRRICNYRISRARKTIECTFGMVCEKFAVLNGPVRIREPENVNFVIKAACVLHNYVRKLEGLPYVSTYPQDSEPNDHIDVRTTTLVIIFLPHKDLCLGNGNMLLTNLLIQFGSFYNYIIFLFSYVKFMLNIN